jgi:chorismate-pyruvate lyase
MNETELKKALAKANQHIEQLCSTVNTLAGFRKVRLEDFRVDLVEQSAWSAPDFPRAAKNER